MTIYHTVLFKFKCLVPPEEVTAACERMLALEAQCKHPQTSQQYVKVLGGGRDNSPEGRQNGITHCFIFAFDQAEDRQYYLDHDPAHRDFVKSLDDIVDTVQVIDFTPGEF